MIVKHRNEAAKTYRAPRDLILSSNRNEKPRLKLDNCTLFGLA